MASPPTCRPALSREDKRFAWVVLVAAWMALIAVVLFRFYPHKSPTLPSTMGGVYRAVEEVVPPVSLRLGEGSVVRLAGIAPPDSPAAAERAAARLSELAPPGTDGSIEIEPPFAGDSPAQPAASVWLPPG